MYCSRLAPVCEAKVSQGRQGMPFFHTARPAPFHGHQGPRRMHAQNTGQAERAAAAHLEGEAALAAGVHLQLAQVAEEVSG